MANSTTAAMENGEISKTVNKQIEAQMERLWEVRGILQTACKAIDHDGEASDGIPPGGTDQPLWWSLKAASSMLEDIHDKLDRLGAAP